MGIVPPARGAGNIPVSRLPDSPAPAAGSSEWHWLQRDAEARQRHEDLEITRKLCRAAGITEQQLMRALVRLLAPVIGELIASTDGGGEE